MRSIGKVICTKEYPKLLRGRGNRIVLHLSDIRDWDRGIWNIGLYEVFKGPDRPGTTPPTAPPTA